ncbi:MULTISPECIES: group-specific protein [unclassified Peribacillus]|uniref:group-specific protein n=1 Tax=unclassified Peribacillus TaxID=2675266 RepID=UPI00382FFA52
MQEYIYHMVPKEMIGDKLIPLHALGKTFPHLYEKYRRKYLDHPERPKLLTKQIPKLNCLWNDVLHFLPLHPYFVYEALASLGIKTKEEQNFFKIPIERLTHNRNAIYLYTKEKYKGPAEDIEEDEIKLLNIETYRELKEIPAASVEYYKTENEKGNRFGLFPYIPHLLSLGEVEINNVEIISWNQLK